MKKNFLSAKNGKVINEVAVATSKKALVKVKNIKIGLLIKDLQGKGI